MDDMRALRVFLAVAQQNSFSKAARQLGMNPASVTRVVAKLEQDLDHQLLVRTTRKVSPTAVGRQVIARYSPILHELDRAQQEVRRAKLPDQGRLRINAPLSMGIRVMPGLIDGFQTAFPNITLDIKLTDSFIDVMSGECDLAIRISGPPSDKSTIWRKICMVPRSVIAAPSLFDRIPKPANPDQLDPAYCMSYSPDQEPETWEFHRGPAMRRIRAGDKVLTNNGDLLYALCRTGTGMTLLPEFISAAGLAAGEVSTVFSDWLPTPLWLTLFYPPYAQLPPLVDTFSTFFEDYMRELDGLDFS